MVAPGNGPGRALQKGCSAAPRQVTTGSYNFSANAERNAENQLHLDHPGTLAAHLAYLGAVTAEYS